MDFESGSWIEKFMLHIRKFVDFSCSVFLWSCCNNFIFVWLNQLANGKEINQNADICWVRLKFVCRYFFKFIYWFDCGAGCGEEGLDVQARRLRGVRHIRPPVLHPDSPRRVLLLPVHPERRRRQHQEVRRATEPSSPDLDRARQRAHVPRRPRSVHINLKFLKKILWARCKNVNLDQIWDLKFETKLNWNLDVKAKLNWNLNLKLN